MESEDLRCRRAAGLESCSRRPRSCETGGEFLSLDVFGPSDSEKAGSPGPRPPCFSDIVRRVVIRLVEELGLLVLQVGVLDEPDELLNVKRVECSGGRQGGDVVRDLCGGC